MMPPPRTMPSGLHRQAMLARPSARSGRRHRGRLKLMHRLDGRIERPYGRRPFPGRRLFGVPFPGRGTSPRRHRGDGRRGRAYSDFSGRPAGTVENMTVLDEGSADTGADRNGKEGRHIPTGAEHHSPRAAQLVSFSTIQEGEIPFPGCLSSPSRYSRGWTRRSRYFLFLYRRCRLSRGRCLLGDGRSAGDG